MIELLDVFGNDLLIVNAARVSFNKESHDLSLNDEKLITYLAKHQHSSPFFHPQIRLRIKMPIFVAREWFRHQIGFARNEVSRRYVDSKPEFWIPSPLEIRERDPKLKQGSKETAIENAAEIQDLIEKHIQNSQGIYECLLRQNVAPEVARCVLPQSMLTEFIETGSLFAYARLYKLRTDPHAQKEIQEFAKKVGELIEPHFPIAWKALTL